jgi:hypothetical protein
MKLILLALALTFTASLHAYNDDHRRGTVLKTKKAWGVPAKQPGGLVLNDMFYVKEADMAILTYLGSTPNKAAIKAAGIAFWASAEGQNLKKMGFKDWVYNYGYFNKTTRTATEYGMFSCAEGKWYRDGEHFFTAHGLK